MQVNITLKYLLTEFLKPFSFPSISINVILEKTKLFDTYLHLRCAGKERFKSVGLVEQCRHKYPFMQILSYHFMVVKVLQMITMYYVLIDEFTKI